MSIFDLPIEVAKSLKLGVFTMVEVRKDGYVTVRTTEKTAKAMIKTYSRLVREGYVGTPVIVDQNGKALMIYRETDGRLVLGEDSDVFEGMDTDQAAPKAQPSGDCNSCHRVAVARSVPNPGDGT